MIDGWLEMLSHMITNNFWIAPMLAFVAGVLTSFLPCSLSSIPLVIGYVGGSSTNDGKKAFKLSLVFSIGMAITFTALGVAAALTGKLLGNFNEIWYIFLGVLMVLMALQTWEIYNFIPSTYLISKNTKKGYMGTLIAGVLGGVFSSPCSTPVLIVLIGIIARSGNIAWGILLFLLYSIGNSILVLVIGTSLGLTRKISSSAKYTMISKTLKIGMGLAILLIGFYMFYLGF